MLHTRTTTDSQHVHIFDVTYLMLQISQVIVNQLFVYDNLADAGHVLNHVLKRPETRHLLNWSWTSKATTVSGVTDGIVDNIKIFLGKVMVTKGTRKTLEQQTYRTVLAACSGENLVAMIAISYCAAIELQ